MGVNRGKQFEKIIEGCFEKVPGVSIDRFHDQMTGFKGSSNICDYIVYKEPYEYYFECKSVHGNTLSISSIPKPDKNGVMHHFYGNITDTQWEGLLEKSKIPGVYAGVICWWVDKDVTMFLPIQLLDWMYKREFKSIRFNIDTSILKIESGYLARYIRGKKKRVFFDYDMQAFFKEVENG